MSSTAPRRRRVGIIGFGALGQFLVSRLLSDPKAQERFEIVFVWNRDIQKVRSANLPAGVVLEDLKDFASREADLLVEVAHPSLYTTFGAEWLKCADVFAGSPTAFAEAGLEQTLRSTTADFGHAVFLPVGALWGAQDIAKMGQRGTITALHITMKKPHASMRLEEPLQTALEAFTADESTNAPDQVVLYHGPVRQLCAMAPNNVNTMALAAIASGTNVGFDAAVATLVAERHSVAHIIEVEVVGKTPVGRSDPFRVTSTRYNPCDPKAVTALATYESFYSSLVNVNDQLNKVGFHFC